MKNNNSKKQTEDAIKKNVLTNKVTKEEENKSIVEVKNDTEKEDEDIILRVNNVTKYYKKRKVLNGITFKVKKGSIHGIIGSNGSGKSTTLKAIVKLIKIDEGEIFINEHQIGGNKKINSKSEFRVNYVPAEPYLPDMEVGEHIFDCAYLLNIPKEEVLKKFSNCELFKFRYYYCQNLSSGWRKVLQLFIATLNKSPLMILDEPMSGLDQRAQEELIDYIKIQKEKGKTIIISTHLLSDLQYFSDEITIISEGKVLYTGPKTENIKDTYHYVGAQKKTSFEKLFSQQS